jgi:hypothetical protein
MCSSAHGQASRTWVSGVGDDANPCSRTAPCKTWAGAISKTAAGGEIDALDPGGFGAVTITKSITLNGLGTFASVLVAGTPGIVVAAGASDLVIIRGLSIDGLGSTPSPGTHGIRFLSGRALRVEDSNLFGFSGNCIDVATAAAYSDMAVRNVTMADCAGNGVNIVGGSYFNATLDNVQIVDSGTGVHARTLANVTVTRSNLSANGYGVVADVSGAVVFLDSSTVAYNANVGVYSTANGQIIMSNDDVHSNGQGLLTSSGGQIYSYGDNLVVANITDGNPSGPVSKR